MEDGRYWGGREGVSGSRYGRCILVRVIGSEFEGGGSYYYCWNEEE